MELETSIEIDVPISDVFALWADLERAPEWAGPVIERRKLTEGPVGVGSQFHAVDQFPGRKLEFTVEITRYEPERLMAAVWHEPMEGGWEARFADSGGGTRLTLSAEMNPSGGVMKLIFPVMGAWAKRAMQKDLERFKRLAESAT